MKSIYRTTFDLAKREWQGSSIVLSSQIDDLVDLAERIKAPAYRKQIREHIDFLIDLNNRTDEVLTSATHLIQLLQFQNDVLNETLIAMGKRDFETLKNVIQNLRK